jgi:phage terminase Nu1 subunit (DNA packaging protein)
VKSLQRDQTAALTGISIQRLAALMRDGAGPPQDVDGQFPVPTFRDWLVERFRDEFGPDDETQEGRLTRARAEKAELEVQEMRGELVRIVDVTASWEALCAAMRARLLVLAPTVAPLVVSKPLAETQAVIQQHVYEALLELAGAEPATRGN